MESNYTMQTGYNSDITYRGVSYHVQTEDWGLENPFIVSRVFQQGAVLRTYKTPYATFLKTTLAPPPKSQLQQHVSLALKSQHDQVVDFVLSGQIFL